MHIRISRRNPCQPNIKQIKEDLAAAQCEHGLYYCHECDGGPGNMDLFFDLVRKMELKTLVEVHRQSIDMPATFDIMCLRAEVLPNEARLYVQEELAVRGYNPFEFEI